MTAAPAPAPSRPLAAALWMSGALTSFAAMTVAGRELTAALDTFEIMAWRSAIGLAIVATILWRREGAAGLRTVQPGTHLLRNSVHFAGQNLWYLALGAIPLAQLTALEFTSPIWLAALAPILLGERLTRARAAAALLGFAGVLAIARPDAGPMEWGHAAALGAALGFALTNILTKRLLRRDGALTMLFWMTATQLVFGLVCAAPGGLAAPPPALWPAMLATGVTGLSAHFCLTRALGHAPATLVAPMEFLRLPLIAAAGLVLYDEPVDVGLAVGAALILVGNVANLRDGRRAT